MLRRFSFLATHRAGLCALLTAAIALLAIQSAPARSRPAAPISKSLLPLLAPAPITAADVDYELQDGSVITGNTAALANASGVTAPGQVDKLDLSRASEIEEQQKKAQANASVFRSTITPHWFANNAKFWYRNDNPGGTKEFILVDAERGTRLPAFDHDKLATGLSKAAAATYLGTKLPFDTIEFVDGEKAIRFSAASSNWQCDLTSYDCKKSTVAPKQQESQPADDEDDGIDLSQNSYPPRVLEEFSPDELMEQQKDQKKAGGQKKGGGKAGVATSPAVDSPDKKWTAFVKGNNTWLRDAEGKETQITQVGVEGDGFRSSTWSPNSKALVTYRVIPGELSKVYWIETSPKDQLPAKFTEKTYPRPGDKFPLIEMWVIDVETMKPTKVEIERIDDAPNVRYPSLRWNKEGTHFTFEKYDRSHLRFRIIEVEARTGKHRYILDDQAQSMINHYSDGKNNTTFFLQYLDPTGEILYLSEMDGWKHLYLIEAKTGKLKQMTKGEWVVRRINKVDKENRQIWFEASGMYADQDPYLLHTCRVNFDGTGLVFMTAGNGTHTVKWSGPEHSTDSKYIIATYQRVDMAPVHELRRVADGSKVCDLEKADVSALEATGWRAPEVFSAKGRDGKTDIWGIVFRPRNFDPNKKYPVIEYIYAGPHSNHVRKTFNTQDGLQTLAELGFIVVKIDGMGTMNRSRAFHAVAWKNLADAGFPDRILWIKALAKKYAYVDTTRVGIYGTSAGGQNALGALLFHPEFYKVAVAACGCHDNRLDKSSWNESWMGLMGPHYEANSNVTHAGKLQGKLFLVVGELDDNVPPESTHRVVDALIKANKDFDLLVLPGMKHTDGGTYGVRRRNDFFVEHLLNSPPPNRNAVGAGAAGKGKKGKQE